MGTDTVLIIDDYRTAEAIVGGTILRQVNLGKIRKLHETGHSSKHGRQRQADPGQ